jgi:2-methylaconitate cis-trans-isomerase PrpF
VNAGNPTVFIHASTLGLSGLELPPAVNGDGAVLARCEAIRSHAAVTMGLAASADAATRDRPATPKLSFVAGPATYLASSGREVRGEDIGLVARILSMGALHHAYTGTGAVALAVAAALPGSVVAQAMRGGPSDRVRIGHASGTLTAGAEVRQHGADWSVTRALMSRSARRLMSGIVHVPDDGIPAP